MISWYVELEIGTPQVGMPAQKFTLHVDTGSSEIWVNSVASSYCQHVDIGCRLNGAYDESASTSKAVINHDFRIGYVGGNHASGDFLTDTIYIAGQYLDSVQFGLAFDSSSDGILGLGYSSGQQKAFDEGKDPYPTMFDIMVRKNMINLKAFSMWLDDPKDGHILYGHIDTTRFHGQLVTVPVVISDTQSLWLFTINLMDVQLSDKANPMKLPLDTFPVPVVLDSGATGTQLPVNLVKEIHRVLQINEPGTLNNGLISCSLMQSDLTLDFTFGTPAKPAMITIPIPMSAIFRPFGFDSLCRIQITPDENNLYNLGINFLSEAYIVYDMTNNQISMAPVKKGVRDTNIIEIDQSGVARPGDSTNSDLNIAIQTEAEAGAEAEIPYDFTTASNAVNPNDVKPAQNQEPGKESALALKSGSVLGLDDGANSNSLVSTTLETPLSNNLDDSFSPEIDGVDTRV